MTNAPEPHYGCSQDECAQEISHPAKGLRVLNGDVICEGCFDHYNLGDDGEPWLDLPAFLPMADYIHRDDLRVNPAEYIRTKELVWRKDPDPEEYSKYGAYMARVSTGCYRIEPRADDQWYLWYPRNNNTMDKKCKSFEAAKDAAQSHANQMLIDMMEVI